MFVPVVYHLTTPGWCITQLAKLSTGIDYNSTITVRTPPAELTHSNAMILSSACSIEHCWTYSSSAVPKYLVCANNNTWPLLLLAADVRINSTHLAKLSTQPFSRSNSQLTQVFYKKLKNVSCEYDRLNGWNSILHAAWYIRHVRWTCLFYISFIIWFLWT